MMVNLVGGPLAGQRANVTPWTDEYATPMLPVDFIAWALGLPTLEVRDERFLFAVYRRAAGEVSRRMVFLHMEVR